MPTNRVKYFLQQNGAWLGLFGLVFIFLILTRGDFGSVRNVTNLLRQASINGVLACGMTLVIITGGIDLSIGSVVAIAGVVAGFTQLSGHFVDFGIWGALGSLVIAMLIGLLCGLISGALVALVGIVPFVTTLGLMVIARGAAMIFSGGASLSPMGEDLGRFADAYIPSGPSVTLTLFFLGLVLWSERRSLHRAIFPAICLITFAYAFYGYKGLPLLVLFMGVVAAITTFLLNSTVFGRSVYAIGSNSKAAYWAGVNIKKTLLIVYSFMGLLSGLAGVLLASRLNSADPNAGQLFELDAIAAVVIGGTSLRGGSGSITGSLVGALTMASLNNGMDLLGVPSFYQMVLKGVIIITAVALDSSQRKNN